MGVDRSHTPELAESVRSTLNSEPRVEKILSLRVRRVGRNIYVDSELSLKAVSLEEAHATASKLEDEIKRKYSNSKITLHLEPTEDSSIIRMLKEKVLEHHEVRGVHHLSIVGRQGKGLGVSFRLELDPKTSLGKVDRIISEVSNSLKSILPPTAIVDMHVELHLEGGRREGLTKSLELEEEILREVMKMDVEVDEVEVLVDREGYAYVYLTIIVSEEVGLVTVNVKVENRQ